MKCKKMSYCIIMAAIFVITPACHAGTSNGKTSIEQIQKETNDLIQTLKAYTSDQRREATQKTKAALDNLDKRIDALEKHIDKKWDKMDKAARGKAQASLKELHKQRVKVAEWYGSLKSSSADAWEQMKKGFSDAYKTLQDTWEKSDREFGSDE
ncbi:MAG: hypothetical protein JW902_08645 [Syntrophaceae bacterium]|nr:hypothetical protein [Syntrophaceae bacterium]